MIRLLEVRECGLPLVLGGGADARYPMCYAYACDMGVSMFGFKAMG